MDMLHLCSDPLIAMDTKLFNWKFLDKLIMLKYTLLKVILCDLHSLEYDTIIKQSFQYKQVLSSAFLHAMFNCLQKISKKQTF